MQNAIPAGKRGTRYSNNLRLESYLSAKWKHCRTTYGHCV